MRVRYREKSSSIICLKCTFFTAERALLLLHFPWLKLPQVPWGVPKLANLIEEMTWLGVGHSRNRKGPDPFPVFESESHMSTGNGWDSLTWEHRLPTCLVAKDICVGSPPISSNNTRVLSLGWSHERGTWYLRIWNTSKYENTWTILKV